ncbi:MAG: methyltransferase domain-containing protein, partial [Azoarcus sp.]|nr:methyltransferase domain-containing protein [Azoarcus sp.]
MEDITIERALPGSVFYLTAIHHLKRYLFLQDFILPGNVLECACGTGYGAAILSRLDTITEYYGVDLSGVAISAAQANNPDARFSFHAVDLAEPAPTLYQNVISLETIEHVPNPYRFIELLIDKMAPDGQLLLSLPAETWAGSHLNPYHFSNWNRKRLMTFLDQYFEDISVFNQKLSLLGPSTFEASGITGSAPFEDSDECFISVLRRPRKKKRPALVLKRRNALGDVIWTTPVLRALRRAYPQHNLLVVTQETAVFMRNPDVDLVFNLQYEPSPDDLFIDLDGAYETRRELHLLQAYAEVCGVPLTSLQPTLTPTTGEARFCASRLLQHFQNQNQNQNQNIERLIGVHMAATSPDRIWPKAHWQQFIADLLERDDKLGIVIFGNGKDFSAADLGIHSSRTLCLVRQLSLMHTAATLALCDILIAPDSGVLHIAAAVGVPWLGLFGMADPATRLPFTAGNRALWADIACRGCLREIPAHQLPLCPRAHAHAECMERILPGEVLSTAARMLEAVMPEQWKTRCKILFPQQGMAGESASTMPAQSLEAKAIAAFHARDFAHALNLFSTLLETEPDNPLPPAYLAFIAAHQGLIQEAHDLIERSARIAPQRADLNAALGETFLQSGHPEQAAVYLQEAVQTQPDLLIAYPALAQSLHLTGRSEEAVSLLQAAAGMPSGAQATLQSVLLQILIERGDLAEFTASCLRFSRGMEDDLLAARCLARFEESGARFLETLSRIQARLPETPPIPPEAPACEQPGARNESGLTRIAFMMNGDAPEYRFEQLYALFRYLPPERFFTIFVSGNPDVLRSDFTRMCGLLADQPIAIPSGDAEALKRIDAASPDILVDLDAYGPAERLEVFMKAAAPRKLLWGETPMPPLAPNVAALAGECLGLDDALPAVTLPGMGEYCALPEMPFTETEGGHKSATGQAARCPVAFTFGCLTPAAGIGRDGWRLFAEVLRQLPESRLVINLENLGTPAKSFIAAQFKRADITPERLAFIHARTAEELCRAWQTIDLGLAAPVNSGGLALPACLWMGKPYIALASSLPWSQRPAALLKATGEARWIARDAVHYIELTRHRQCAQEPPAPDPALRARVKALGIDDPVAFA